MKVTLDIPEGYEAKIVKVQPNDETIFAFKMNYNGDVAAVIFETVKTLYSRVGWTGFLLHSSPSTNRSVQYTVTAYKK
jgi:hypothetical protein